MDVRLSPDQVALRQSAAQLVDALAAKSVQALDNVERATKLDAAVDAAGWRELRVAESGDRPLASAVEVALIAEELGHALADTPFLGPSLAADLRRRAGAPAGPTTETVALTTDLARLAGTVDADACTVVDAHHASAALLVAADHAGYRLQSAPVMVTGAGIDLTRPLARAVPAHASDVPSAARALSADDMAAWSAFALAIVCADLIGVMRGAVRSACDYAAIRRQYGVPIGSFQAVQHALADAFVALEGARSVALHAAWAADALPAGDALAAARVAKAYCGRAARDVCETVIQVHGGIGNTWECLAHVFLRRALLSIDVLGDVGTCLAAVLADRGIETVGR